MTRKIVYTILLFLVPLSRANTFQFTVTKDAGISQAADAGLDPTHGPGWRGGGDSSFWVNGYKCWLIGVDLPADLIDASQVQTATLAVRWNVIYQPREFCIYQFNHPWSADPAIGSCWNFWQDNYSWPGNEPRQTKGLALDSETLAPGNNVNYAYNVKTAVQNWLNGDINYGFLIWSSVSTQYWEARQASASESAAPPVFTITYTPYTPSTLKTYQYTITNDCSVNLVLPALRGGAVNPIDVLSQSLWLMGVELPPDLTQAGHVQSATLTVNWDCIQQPRQVDVHQYNHPWSDDPNTGSCWNYWLQNYPWAGYEPRQSAGVLSSDNRPGTVSQPGGDLGDNLIGDVSTFDVTPAVINWLNGAVNYGFMVMGTTSTADWERRFGFSAESYFPPVVTIKYIPLVRTAGDADGDGKVDVSDLGILAANYGTTAGATWEKGDFNGDGKVDVSDLGILAANYGMGTGDADFKADYAKVFGAMTAKEDDTSPEEKIPESGGSICGGLGLSLISVLFLAGLVLLGVSICDVIFF